MKRVIIESPYGGDTWEEIKRNERYARACMRDSLLRGEAPYLSHLLYTQPNVLDDNIPEERRMGIDAGFAWRATAEYTVVYRDLGISRGMQEGIENALAHHHYVYWREIGWPPDINTIYLAGAMEQVEDQGLGWRRKYSTALGRLGIRCILPNDEESHLIPDPDTFLSLKDTDFQEHQRIMRLVKEQDLKFVQSVDAVVCRWDGEIIAGTVGEAQHATFHAVPFYLVCKRPYRELSGWMEACATEIFPSLEKLMEFLNDL